MKLLLIIALVLSPIVTNAATGDIIATSLISDNPAASGPRTIVSGAGCVGDTGTCVKMDCVTGDCSASGLWSVDFTDTPSVTIDWWEKYDVWPLTWSVGGCKSIRPFHGTQSDEYYGTLISFHSDHGYQNGFYSGYWTTAQTNFSSYVTGYNDELCTGSSNPYTCSRVGISWSIDGGVTSGMGTTWRHMRQYVKMPTSYTSADGEVRLWVDGLEIHHTYNIDMEDHGGLNITHVNFAPIDESATPHGHWYDNITIYEGYVPPDGQPSSVVTTSKSPGRYKFTPIVALSADGEDDITYCFGENCEPTTVYTGPVKVSPNLASQWFWWKYGNGPKSGGLYKRQCLFPIECK